MTDINLTDAGIPQHGQLALPLLQVIADGNEWTRQDLVVATLDAAGVSQELRELQYGTSGHYAAENRVGWAKSELTRARLIESIRRGVFRITDAGRTFLADHPAGFTKADLEALPAWDEYVPRRRIRSGDIRIATTGEIDDHTTDAQTPDERIDDAISEVEEDIKTQLLTRLKEGDPRFFERVVRQLLVKMGYGREGQLSKLRGPGDSGIDGVVDRDELGLSRIYIQAKRYADATVGRPAVQEFVGALATRGAATGVFFTTSRFADGAIEAAERVSHDIALVDGLRLAELMIKHRVGVEVDRAVEIVRLNEDFFE
ncbi:restriction endonuclease [Protaetiibacter intestinalis]|uniref:Restriction endonuclease n=1 Tax=Protaetiibacter intestinalis TaxID=2419774 RepID=A0A387B386_9MICO|nr:restriction endonuclease [Protaetiibacter intestinalis]AYF98064.1 restriction endonuclease [Protaetiibacter intestinalis]